MKSLGIWSVLMCLLGGPRVEPLGIWSELFCLVGGPLRGLVPLPAPGGGGAGLLAAPPGGGGCRRLCSDMLGVPDELGASGAPVLSSSSLVHRNIVIASSFKRFAPALPLPR